MNRQSRELLQGYIFKKMTFSCPVNFVHVPVTVIKYHHLLQLAFLKLYNESWVGKPAIAEVVNPGIIK